MSVNDQLPLHGGDLISASQRYGIPVADWLDLSTGLNPSSYPVPELSPVLFQRLPYLRPEFLQAAAVFYGNAQLLPSNGSQLVIQELPSCLNELGLIEFGLDDLPVLLPEHGYKEHEDHWRRHGNAVQYYPAFEPQAAVEVIESVLDRGDP
ncbi:MAG: hypothetical protein OIF34_01975, partial [Porticoccaceae bacterium]|nr:hypothetical protein [Porticoccaceae bacterium]